MGPRIRQKVYEVSLRAKQSFAAGFEAVSAIDMGLNNPKNLESKEEAEQCMKISERITSLKSRIKSSPVNKLPVVKKRKYVEVFQNKKSKKSSRICFSIVVSSKIESEYYGGLGIFLL